MFIGLSRPSLGCMHIAMARFPRPDETRKSSLRSLIQTALARKVMCVLEWLVAINLGRSGLLSLPFPYTKFGAELPSKMQRKGRLQRAG
jgi:hypothetical protein